MTNNASSPRFVIPESCTYTNKETWLFILNDIVNVYVVFVIHTTRGITFALVEKKKDLLKWHTRKMNIMYIIDFLNVLQNLWCTFGLCVEHVMNYNILIIHLKTD